MILPMVCCSPGVERGCAVGWWSVRARAAVAARRRARAGARGRGGGSRAGAPATTSPSGRAAARHVAQRLVLVRVERLPERLDRRDALASRAGARSLRSIATIPSSHGLSRASGGRCSRARSKSSASSTTLREQRLAGAVEVALPVGLRAALEVRVVGARRAARSTRFSSAFASAASRSAVSCRDLGEERRRARLELGDPVVRAGPAARRSGGQGCSACGAPGLQV